MIDALRPLYLDYLSKHREDLPSLRIWPLH